MKVINHRVDICPSEILPVSIKASVLTLCKHTDTQTCSRSGQNNCWEPGRGANRGTLKDIFVFQSYGFVQLPAVGSAGAGSGVIVDHEWPKTILSAPRTQNPPPHRQPGPGGQTSPLQELPKGEHSGMTMTPSWQYLSLIISSWIFNWDYWHSELVADTQWLTLSLCLFFLV